MWISCVVWTDRERRGHPWFSYICTDRQSWWSWARALLLNHPDFTKRRSPRFTAGVRRLVGQPLLLQPLLPTHFGKCCLLSGHNSLFYLAYLVLPSSVPELEAHAASYSFIYYNYAFIENGISPQSERDQTWHFNSNDPFWLCFVCGSLVGNVSRLL